MSEIELTGEPAWIGNLAVEPTEDGTQVRLTVTAGGIVSELITTFTLNLKDAEALSGMLDSTIDQVSDTIEQLAAETEATDQSYELPSVEEPAPPDAEGDICF
jgi:hypothetical protein